MSSLLNKLSESTKIYVVKPLFSNFQIVTEYVGTGSRRELVATCVHTTDTDATQLDG